MIVLKKIVVVVFLIVGKYSISQALNNKEGLTNFTKINFNKELISSKKVRSITTEYMIKKELSPIDKKPKIKTYYEYNDSGLLTMYYRTFLLHDTIYDTLVEFYTYNEKHQLKELIKSEYGKYGIYTYKYDKKGRVVNVSRAEEENAHSSKIVFIPSKHKEVSKEYFEFSNIDSLSYMKYTLSDDNIRYKEKEVIFENGKLKKSYERLIFGSQKYKVYNYKYFEDKLVSKNVINNFDSKLMKRYVYRYYSDGNLSSMETHIKKENDPMFTIDFLYKDTKLLGSILKKNEKTGTIEITKFKYSHY